MAKSSRAYRSAKRGKELSRQKKQEEKRLRRLAREKESHGGGEGPPLEGETPEPDKPESQ